MIYEAKRDLTVAVDAVETTQEPAAQGFAELQTAQRQMEEGLDLFTRAIEAIDEAGQWLSYANRHNGYVGLRLGSIHELFSMVTLGESRPLVDQVAEKKNAYNEMNAHTRNSEKLLGSLVENETGQLHQIKTLLQGVITQNAEFLEVSKGYNDEVDQIHSEAVEWRDSM